MAKKNLFQGMLRGLQNEAVLFSYLIIKRKWPIFFRSKLAVNPHFQKQFFYDAFTPIGKLALVDGAVEPRQYQLIEEFMTNELGLNANAKVMALQILRGSRAAKETFRELLQEYKLRYGTSRVMLLHLMGVFMDVAMADNKYTEQEKELINQVVDEFKITPAELDKLKKRHNQLRRLRAKRISSPKRPNYFRVEAETQKESDPRPEAERIYEKNDPYALLGVKRTDSINLIKRHYRKLVLRYHPDRLKISGLSDELMEQAITYFREIQSAYEEVCKEKEQK